MSSIVGRLLLYLLFAAALSIAPVMVTPEELMASPLSELAAAANKEGALNAAVISSLNGRAHPKLAAAFKKRFGLDIDVTITNVRSTTQYGRAAATTKAGATPTYDTMEGSELSNIQLLGVGGAQKIENWQALLAEINPMVGSGKVKPEQISPKPFTGLGFKYMSRVKGLLYNPKLISESDLPKTHSDLGNPKYKGMWTQPPWTSHWEVGPLIFPKLGKEKWLEVVRKAGKNSGAVEAASKGVQRILLGEFAFGLANTYEALRAHDLDPDAPIAVTYFQDYNQTNSGYYIVRKGARHPAAATLFAIWMGTPEAKSIWQPITYGTQFLWGESKLDRTIRNLINKSHARVVDYLENDESLALLEWYGTEAGRKYSNALAQAIRGR
jgi:ABC-type Fe3+ transport system substrate-binding protein